MAQAGAFHYVGFFVGVSGLTTTDFVVDVFTKDGTSVDAPTLASLEVIEVGVGYYYAKYLPSSSGLYYLGISNSDNFINVGNAVAITEADSYVYLTQDTGGTNALRPTLPFNKFNPGTISDYVLLVYLSSDWRVGRNANIHAVAVTQLDHGGNWLSSPLTVQHDTYHIVIKNNDGVSRVIKANLEV